VHFPPRVDRVDIFDNPRRDEPGQPPKLSMAWRGAQCLDETRDHAESLFAGHFLNEDGLDFGKYVQKGSVALDIGACYGDTAFPMAPYASTILAFEPNPHSYAVLDANARLNPTMGLIPYNVAAGSDGSADLYFGGDFRRGPHRHYALPFCTAISGHP
jgi:hypothetical protein